MFPYINLVRFAAAFWVLIFHAQLHFGDIAALGVVGPIIGQGVLAMSLFFMLSGFILSYRYLEFTEVGSWRAFYKARLRKLYPVYFFMGVVTIATLASPPEGLALVGGWGYYVWLLFVIFLFVFCLQAWFPVYFDVWNFGGSWSLSAEAFFYLLFPSLRNALGAAEDRILVRVIYGAPVVVLALYAVLIACLGSAVSPLVFYMLPIFRMPEFILGIAGYCYFVERKAGLGNFRIVCVLCLIAGVYFVYRIGDLPGGTEYGALFVVPFLFLMVKLARPHEMPRTASLIFDYLGSVSYCLYIVQFGTVPLMVLLFDGFSVGTKWVCFIAANSVLAVLLHHLVERPANLALHRASRVANA
ncbi:hypothetical protein HYN69_02215 [Gemmobacter aquarius]|uniref:Acyltransferase 3 domain-containing protein n=1 Tax=Paragemmobacter aquarius TaxID=2169400 RepID=A0A2S0UI51_9RHOB|nr:acyltransferase [Gemmobacter aquarius]AWB47479.1 hypothetical protein HYN69_02215 [Gemmobacter aquarius]